MGPADKAIVVADEGGLHRTDRIGLIAIRPFSLKQRRIAEFGGRIQDRTRVQTRELLPVKSELLLRLGHRCT